MHYRVAPLARTPAERDGLSERLVTSHCENNDGRAVRLNWDWAAQRYQNVAVGEGRSVARHRWRDRVEEGIIGAVVWALAQIATVYGNKCGATARQSNPRAQPAGACPP